MKMIFAFIVALALSCHLSAQTLDSILWQNVQRSYQLYLPKGYSTAKKYPVIMACHPGLSNAAQHAEVARWQIVGDTAGFISVYPNGMPSTANGNTRLWNAYDQPSTVAEYDDVGFLNALLDRLIAQYSVDTCRIYMSGFSNGAMMTYRMACDFTQRFAAMAPLSGGWGYGSDGSCGDGNCNGDVAPGCTWRMAYVNCSPSNPIPMIFMKGSNEGDNLPTCRGTIDSLNRLYWSSFLKCGSSRRDTLQAGGERVVREMFTGCNADFQFHSVIGNSHQWHAPATPIFWSFLRQQSKCIPVSVHVEPEQSLDIYPNPVDGGVLNLRITGYDVATITVTDALGRMIVRSMQVSQLNVAGLTPGMYIVILESPRQRVAKQVIIR
jgi:polyhydroxybutyrate depolymerase